MVDIAELREKDRAELKTILDGLLHEQCKLRLKKGELKEINKIKQVRRNIARVLTLLGMKDKV